MTDDLEDLKRRLVVGHKSDGRSVYDKAAKSQLVALCLLPPAGILPGLKRAKPYVYGDAEINALLAAALSLPPIDGLRRWTYHYLFGLIAVTGMRLSEAIGLAIMWDRAFMIFGTDSLFARCWVGIEKAPTSRRSSRHFPPISATPACGTPTGTSRRAQS